MESRFCNLCCVLMLSLVFSLSVAAQGTSSITGIIYNAADNRPVSDVVVELQNDVYSTLGRQKVPSSGRYTFSGLSQGNYKVKVIPLLTNFIEESRDVQIRTVSFGNRESTSIEYQDFYLRLDKRRVNAGDSSPAESVFVQEVPKDAEKLFKAGNDQLADKKDIGIESVEKALVILPNYFEALKLLGTEYANRKEYERAIPYLEKAVLENPRSFSCYYLLGRSYIQTRNFPEAIKALEATKTLLPQDTRVKLSLGIAFRLNKQFASAEAELLKAEKLSEQNPNPEIYWELGLLYNKMGRNKEAADKLELFIKYNKNADENEKAKILIKQLRAAK
jgi:tetratricopeptide (TPR) repeat protein